MPFGALVKPVLHGVSTGIDVANNLVSNVRKGKTRKAKQDVQTLVDVGNTMYTSINTQLPMNSEFISDIRNNSRQGFQSNQQAQPRQNAPIDQLFGNPMNGMIVAQPPRQNILNSFD